VKPSKPPSQVPSWWFGNPELYSVTLFPSLRQLELRTLGVWQRPPTQ
jgi:hypothetical protein